MHIIIASERQEALRDFANGLGDAVAWKTALEVLSNAQGSSWPLVIVDALTPGLNYKQFLMDLLQRNALINTAVITDMDAEAFHEDSEGLGVLCALPPCPGHEDASALLERLRTLLM